MIRFTFLAYAFKWMTLMVWLPTFLSEGKGLDLGSAAVTTATVDRSARWQIYLATLVTVECVFGIFLPVLTDATSVGLAEMFSFIGGLNSPGLFNMV